TSDDKSLKTLWLELSGSIADLFRNEVRLAKAELSEKTHAMTGALLAILGGIAIALASLVILLQALVVALSDFMDTGWAALLVGLVAGIIGLVLVMGGAKALKPSNLQPDRTMDELKQDKNLVKEHAHEQSTAKR